MSALWPIVRTAISSPTRIAVIDDRRKYTFGQLLGGSFFVAEHLDARTQRKHVGILLPTSGAFPLALLGVWMTGRVAVPLNFLLAPEELTYVIHDSDIDTIITTRALLDFMGGPSRIPQGIRIEFIEDIDYHGMPPLRWPPLNAGDDLAVILYTSGTSGRPKGVMLTHRNLTSDVWAGVEHAQITRADTFLGVLPQFHSFGLTALTLIPLFVGSKVVYTARFVPKRIVELIREHRPDIVMAVPSMYGALLSVKDAGPADFASIRFAISGGEPLPAAVFDACLERFSLRLLEGYGLTETSPATNWCTPTKFKRTSVGTPLPGVTEIVVDEKDRPLPPNREGEILIAGPIIMKGYYKLPEQTKAVMVEIPPDPRTGFPGFRGFRTGDYGRIDEEGFLYITGRKKEMLIIGGENVFPREIEEVLNKHPSVRDSAVIGKRDDLRGEVPVAFVEIEEGAAFDEGALRAWCRDALAGYKVPREIHQVQQLPRSPTGKILRRHLKA